MFSSYLQLWFRFSFSFVCLVYLLFWFAMSEMYVMCCFASYCSCRSNNHPTSYAIVWFSFTLCFSSFYSLFEWKQNITKTETAFMTPSDNIVYVLCIFFFVTRARGMSYVSCVSKTNIVRRWLNYVCLLSTVANTMWLSVCVCLSSFVLRHK